MSEHRLAIIGGGPFCTYALERLVMLLPGIDLADGLNISIFERTGEFGAGSTHSYAQATTSYMNRVASQIAFAADESNSDSSRLLAEDLRPSFAEWCQGKYQATGDRRFKLLPTEMPHRYLHGEALKEAFERYVTELRKSGKVTIDLYDAEVADVSHDDDPSQFRVHVGGLKGWFIRAHQVLFVTGHSNNHPAPGSLAETLGRHALRFPPARYLPRAYPLQEHLTETSVPPGCSVAVLGLGLTAIDILLHLTEGRGGTFLADEPTGACPRLRYLPGGREPGIIVGVSPSGMFPSCRPENAKAAEASGRGHSALQHQGVFLTSGAISTLRRNRGTQPDPPNGEMRQLDFELHVFPLVVLEMAYVYYTTLFGKQFDAELRQAVDSRYQAFLAGGCASRDAGTEYLLEPIQLCFEDVAAYIERVGEGAQALRELQRFDGTDVLETFFLTIYGPGCDRLTSPWGHSPDVREHRFCWRKLFEPLAAEAMNGAEWQTRLMAYMRNDHLAATQGNLRNPVKAACDGVWRDLRSVFSEVADFGGLTAHSHRRFMEIYVRFYSRMSNGIGLEPMRKVLALIESGLVDVSIGPGPVVAPVPGCPSFRISGAATQTEREVGVVVEGRTPPFDPERDVGPLYPNLYRRGFVRRWRNPGAGSSEDFIPGGLDLSRLFHPVQSDGTVEQRLTILGAPAEGVAFFQLSAARPRSNSAILNNVARWANGFVETIGASPDRDAGVPANGCPSITAFRSRVRSLLLSGGGDAARRDVIILAIDGIPHELAIAAWPHASISKMRSVFPSTSSTGWLSSLTGADVGRHGIPGVVFKASDGELINVFEHKGRLDSPAMGNIFSDAAAFGYVPLSVLGDWEQYDCSWRNALLCHSQPVWGHRFYTAPSPPEPEALRRAVLRAVSACLDGPPAGAPRLVWCFIDADRHIHRKGYDGDLMQFLRLIDDVAVELAGEGAAVIAHSDHGLTFTNHNPEIERLMEQIQARYGCAMGGAGRTRWIYAQPMTEDRIIAMLQRSLPPTVRICPADEVFGEGSLARARVGEIVLIAGGEEFMTFSGHRFDHGSSTEAELNVPFAQWMA